MTLPIALLLLLLLVVAASMPVVRVGTTMVVAVVRTVSVVVVSLPVAAVAVARSVATVRVGVVEIVEVNSLLVTTLLEAVLTLLLMRLLRLRGHRHILLSAVPRHLLSSRKCRFTLWHRHSSVRERKPLGEAERHGRPSQVGL